jgi:hypothetical protein
MPVASAFLLMRKEALRQEQVQMILRARHRDIKETALLLDLRCAARGEVRRDAAINHVQNKDRSPFLALRLDPGVLGKVQQTRLLSSSTGWISVTTAPFLRHAQPPPAVKGCSCRGRCLRLCQESNLWPVEPRGGCLGMG